MYSMVCKTDVLKTPISTPTIVPEGHERGTLCSIFYLGSTLSNKSVTPMVDYELRVFLRYFARGEEWLLDANYHIRKAVKNLLSSKVL
jgi:hypothetical protein